MSDKMIEISGARTHNLRDVSVALPQGRLTVITGPSGSGKSSLAFDTLYAEGQRRFVESMSTYARQFIEKMERPDVDFIRNIQPAIAIEQKNSVKNARSTIGTATEISDYLRLLFAKAGTTVCPDCKRDVQEDTPQSVAAELLTLAQGARIYVVAPVPRATEVSASALRTELARAGFARLFVQGRERPYIDLDDPESAAEAEAALEEPVIRLLTDRAVVDESDIDRLTSGIATSFQAGHGTVEIYFADGPPAGVPDPLVVHTGYRCNGCGREFVRPEPNLFSFNSPLGACAKCSGFGRVTGVDWEKVLPDYTLTLNEKPVAPFNTPSYKSNYKWLTATAKAAGVPFDVPLEELAPEQLDALKYGVKGHEGISEFFKWLETEKYKVQSRIVTARYRGFTECPDCRGARLVSSALNVLWKPQAAGPEVPRRNIAEISALSIGSLLAAFEEMELTTNEEELIGRVYREVVSRLQYLNRVGLGYLTLERQTRTLSGGEAQRINLATALGTSLTKTLYVLDEPTVGLHPRDSRRLLGILKDLRDKGNTLVVVEHDPELILGADHLVDIGPAAGSGGGTVIFEGTPANLMKNGKGSLTAKYLKMPQFKVGEGVWEAPTGAAGAAGTGKAKAKAGTALKAKGAGKAVAAKAGKAPAGPDTLKAIGIPPRPSLRIVGARENNLKNLNVEIPLGKWVCVSGVSGSGKTTLIHSILYQGFCRYAKQPGEEPGKHKYIEGLDQIKEVILVDQAAIGRSSRSNPVTYVKAYDPIRRLMAWTREARALGLGDAAFSFNVPGGRCEACEGTGVTTYDMHFLAEISLPCEACGGKRFGPRVLEIRYQGKSIDEILNLTVDDATEFFAAEKQVVKKLQPLRDVGLGYLTLGQNTATLSGGEAQRLKLAAHLSVNSDGKGVMMILDEPTTGLHLADLDVLSKVFRSLVASGYSLVIIEHNLEIIRQADWVVDLGPDAGSGGGELVASGTPEHVAKVPGSWTGRFLAEVL